MFPSFDDSERRYYIYRHLKNSTGQPFYIGIGKKRVNVTLSNEYSRAFDTNARSEYWKRIHSKHGRTVEILLENLLRYEAIEKEKEFIILYGRDDKGGILSNRTDGGDGSVGYKHPPHIREKMKASASRRIHPEHFTEEHKRKISEARKGYKHSLKTRLKMSASMRGKSKPGSKKPKPALFKPVVCLETGVEYPSIKAAAKIFKNQHSAEVNISAVCKGKLISYKGFTFKYI